MKFKFLGIMWDMAIPLGMLWAFSGAMILGGTFALPEMSGPVLVGYALFSFVWIATAESVSKKLMNDGENHENSSS